MDKFTVHKGICAPLIRHNVDTDAIIPSREMRSVSKIGLSDGLFAAWRYLDEATRLADPEFVLNRAAYQNASILLSGNNFGCGSSREHAVWALKEFGFRCIIAQSYGAIFYRNCVANGILPIILEVSQISKVQQELIEAIKENSRASLSLEIDLEHQTIKTNSSRLSFEIGVNEKKILLHGLDPISETMNLQESINVFRKEDKLKRSWVHNKEQPRLTSK